MRAEQLKVNQWYEINGVGPRYLAHTIQDAAPSWEFHLHDTGTAKEAEILVVKDAANVVNAVNPPPTAAVPEWGTQASDLKIFGLDGKDKSTVIQALKVGYRCFDTAKTYKLSAADLSDAFATAKVSRKDCKIVYKVGHGTTKDSIDDVIDEAVKYLSYIDILMVHEDTDALLSNIQAINRRIEKGHARAGGLSNIDSGALTKGKVTAADLKYMVMLQDSLVEIQLENTAPGSRATKNLQEAGNKVIDSIYGLHSNSILAFTEEESRKLKELQVDPFQARTIWASQLGYAELVSSSNPVHMAQNLQPIKIGDQVAAQVVKLVNAKISQSQATTDSKVWKEDIFKNIYDAAQLYATANDLAGFVLKLKTDVLSNARVMNMIVTQYPLKLKTSDPIKQHIIGGITWDKLFNNEKVDEQCSPKDVLESIAEYIRDLDEKQ